MIKLKEGDVVVFTFNGINRIGVIEDIKIVNRVKRYQCRAEGGQLYPHIGTNTETPGKINLPLTDAYFAAKTEEAKTVNTGIINKIID